MSRVSLWLLSNEVDTVKKFMESTGHKSLNQSTTQLVKQGLRIDDEGYFDQTLFDSIIKERIRLEFKRQVESMASFSSIISMFIGRCIYTFYNYMLFVGYLGDIEAQSFLDCDNEFIRWKKMALQDEGDRWFSE